MRDKMGNNWLKYCCRVSSMNVNPPMYTCAWGGYLEISQRCSQAGTHRGSNGDGWDAELGSGGTTSPGRKETDRPPPGPTQAAAYSIPRDGRKRTISIVLLDVAVLHVRVLTGMLCHNRRQHH